ncbi:MAG: ATPase [Saprospiraceae bacterium]|nr:ATPase [Saprospiraceae bacterium]
MATQNRPLSILCIASFFKGEEFMRAAKAEGCTVYLITSASLKDAKWPRESLDDVFLVNEVNGEKGVWNMDEVIAGLAWVMQTRPIDRIVSLDDFDVEKGTALREHFRIPGMGQTTGRYFRDKLAMRIKAQMEGIACPRFSDLFNNDCINAYLDSVAAPWLIKPRGEASATGIKKAHNKDEAWRIIHELGDKRHQCLIEQFRPGDVYHVDSINLDGKCVFTRVSRYLSTPMDVAHGGGVFRSVVVEFGSEDDKILTKLNTDVMKAFGMNYSASHTEFIKDRETGQFVFLETASRVGGANLAEMVEFSSGINLWREWARVEAAMGKGEKYVLPKPRKDYAGIVVSLSRHKHPNTEGFNDPEIVWRMNKEYHIGLIVQAKTQQRVLELLDNYTQRIFNDFHASQPVPNKPSN